MWADRESLLEVPEDPIDSGGRHLNPEEFAKEVAQRLKATEPKSKKRPARKLKEKKQADREKPVDRGSKATVPFLSRLASWVAVVGLCFGIGIAIAATVVWATGSLPGAAAEPTIPPSVTFPGQVATTVQDPVTTVPPSTTVVGDTTTTASTPETTTTTDGSMSTTGTTTPPPTTTTTRPPTTTSTTTPPTTTSTTTTTTAPAPTGQIFCDGGSCHGRDFSNFTVTYSCQNYTTCQGQLRFNSGNWTDIDSGQGSGQPGPWEVRLLISGPGGNVTVGPYTFTVTASP